MKLPSIETAVGQKALAFVAVWLGCIVMTILAAIAVYLVRRDVAASLTLGLAAHAQIALGLAVFGAHFVRRTIKAGRDGIEIADAVDAVAEAATAKAEGIKADA